MFVNLIGFYAGISGMMFILRNVVHAWGWVLSPITTVLQATFRTFLCVHFAFMCLVFVMFKVRASEYRANKGKTF
jgi:hypothetical protein